MKNKGGMEKEKRNTSQGKVCNRGLGVGSWETWEVLKHGKFLKKYECPGPTLKDSAVIGLGAA